MARLRQFGARTALGITVTDWAIALGVAGLLLAAGLLRAGEGAGHVVLGCVFLVLGGLSLAARRRAPLAVLLVASACTVGYLAAGIGLVPVAFMIAVYSAVRAGRGRATVITGTVLVVGGPALVLLLGTDTKLDRGTGEALLGVGWVIAAGVAGEALRQSERRTREAERGKEEAARRRAGEERLRIARELHDSLTHQISIVKVQAGVAVHLARKRGEEVPPALLAIQEAGREAIRELRATLEALRSDEEDRPSHGLTELPALIEQVGKAGLPVELAVSGDPQQAGGGGGVPAAVESAAFRVVQESLTNMHRHAGPACTGSVRIDYLPGLLTVRVEDDGLASSDHLPPVPGTGLLGMRERVTALGGRLRAQPRDEGGFAVHAEFPVDLDRRRAGAGTVAVERRQVELRAAEPKSAELQPVEPQPAEPQPAEPQPAEPQPAAGAPR